MFEAVLFDAAETLFHTRGTVGEIYGQVARKYGSSTPFEIIHRSFLRQFQHSGPLSTANEKNWWKEVVRRVFEEVGMVRDFDQFFEEVYDKFRGSEGWVLFPETEEVLSELKSRRIKLGVISNFDSRVYSVMSNLRILRFFDTVTISSETGFAKPDPRIFEAAISALGISPTRTLLVGDNPQDDVEAGSRVGLTAILVDRNGKYAGRNLRMISSLHEVVSLVDEK